MNRYLIVLLLAFSLKASGKTNIKTDTVSFVFEGKKLTGLLDLPVDQKTNGIILLIPGSGETNMVAGNGYYRRLRHFFAGLGLACYVWDKPGCGRSEGIYDDGDMQSSACEAIAAIEALKQLNLPGADRIGLWGLSRGGWVCPLIITQYPSISFWISVSGPDAEDNFGYLLERNFRIEGRSNEDIQILMKAWQDRLDIARHGGTFEEYLHATEQLRNDPFYKFILGDSPTPTKENYLKWQKGFQNGENLPVNERTGRQIYVTDFDKTLDKISCPVLAVFGEKDSQVNWQRTKALYNAHIGKNPPATLTVRTFPDGNHNLFKCKTGGFREKLDQFDFCDDYLDAMAAWLKENEGNNAIVH